MNQFTGIPPQLIQEGMAPLIGPDHWTQSPYYRMHTKNWVPLFTSEFVAYSTSSLALGVDVEPDIPRYKTSKSHWTCHYCGTPSFNLHETKCSQCAGPRKLD